MAPPEFVYEKKVDYFRLSDTVDQWLFEKPPTFDAYGIAVPVICSLGIVVNLVTYFIYFHPDLRSSSSLILKALLLSDTLYLLMTAVTLTPRIWLSAVYQRGNYDHFWTLLKNSQDVYMICFPLYQIFQVMCGLYSMMLIAEQCATFFIPDKMSKWMKGDGGIKLVITVLNLVIICHLIVFFKFKEKTVLVKQHYPGSPNNETVKFEAKRMCLSTIYNSAGYQNLERYIFFIFLELIPWLVTFISFVLCILEYIKLKKDVSQMPTMDPSWLRVLRSGRSLRTVLTLTATYLVLKAIAHGIYMVTVEDMNYSLNDEKCYLTPMDTRFLKIPMWQGVMFTFTHLVNSSIKPWLCIISSHDLRNLVFHGSQKCCANFQLGCRKCCLFLSPCRTTSNTPESQMRNFNSNIERY